MPVYRFANKIRKLEKLSALILRFIENIFFFFFEVAVQIMPESTCGNLI